MTGVSTAFTRKKAASNLDIIGVHLYADTRDPESPTYVGPDGGIGIRWLVGSTNLLIEDCVIDSYLTNISISADLGPISNVAIRRNIVTDAYVTSGHSKEASLRHQRADHRRQRLRSQRLERADPRSRTDHLQPQHLHQLRQRERCG
jgi:hypothetical protein